MKRSIITAIILTLVLTLFPPIQQTASAQHGFQISFGFFYHRLSPYGRWVHYQPYGWVWYPVGVRRHWQPYADDGYWTYTEYGWTWVSYYDWGWMPFHYGSWTWSGRYGWVWVPGYVWAPAWVTWSYGPSYIGWAPLPPDFAFGYGYGYPTVRVIESAWVFMPVGYFGRYDVRRYRVPYERNGDCLYATRQVTNITVVNNYVVNPGPQFSQDYRVDPPKFREHKIGDLSLSPQPIQDSSKGRRIGITTPNESYPIRDQKDARDPYSPRRGSDEAKPSPLPGDQPKGYGPIPSTEPALKGSHPNPDSKGAREPYAPRRGSDETKSAPYRDDQPKGYAPVSPTRPAPYPETKSGEPTRGWPDTKGSDDRSPKRDYTPAQAPRPSWEYRTPPSYSPNKPEPRSQSPVERKYEPPRYGSPAGADQKQPRYIPSKPLPPSQPEVRKPAYDHSPAKRMEPPRSTPQRELKTPSAPSPSRAPKGRDVKGY